MFTQARGFTFVNQRQGMEITKSFGWLNICKKDVFIHSTLTTKFRGFQGLFWQKSIYFQKWLVLSAIGVRILAMSLGVIRRLYQKSSNLFMHRNCATDRILHKDVKACIKMTILRAFVKKNMFWGFLRILHATNKLEGPFEPYEKFC